MRDGLWPKRCRMYSTSLIYHWIFISTGMMYFGWKPKKKFDGKKLQTRQSCELLAVFMFSATNWRNFPENVVYMKKLLQIQWSFYVRIRCDCGILGNFTQQSIIVRWVLSWDEQIIVTWNVCFTIVWRNICTWKKWIHLVNQNFQVLLSNV